ncbi:MAG: putative GNAT family acetyltransferase [Oceanicoccus sp.]|jgi:predicted GNAT family acetyltransferase
MTNITSNSDILHHIDESFFSIGSGDNAAVLEYQLGSGNIVNFSRTFVPDQYRGQGLAERLVREGLCWARDEGYMMETSCWYVQKFLAREPQ